MHQRGCSLAGAPGHAIGRKKRRRNAQDLERLRVHERLVWGRDGCCQRCKDVGRDVHHVRTVQACLAAGLDWGDIDAVENLRLLCRRCHDWVHTGDPAQAKLDGWLISR